MKTFVFDAYPKQEETKRYIDKVDAIIIWRSISPEHLTIGNAKYMLDLNFPGKIEVQEFGNMLKAWLKNCAEKPKIKNFEARVVAVTDPNTYR